MCSQVTFDRIIAEHWYASDVDTTYSTFLEVDAIAFLGKTIYLFSDNIVIVAAYVEGLLHAKDNMTPIEPYTEYLFRADNLCTALLIVAGQFGAVQAAPNMLTSLLIKIVKLCPSSAKEAQSVWNTALECLEAFSNSLPDDTKHKYFHHNSEWIFWWDILNVYRVTDLKLILMISIFHFIWSTVPSLTYFDEAHMESECPLVQRYSVIVVTRKLKKLGATPLQLVGYPCPLCLREVRALDHYGQELGSLRRINSNIVQELGNRRYALLERG
ncbi:hypothetical protein CPB85DRAFT_1249817 [Mucidula mucida]|nr:hypothetical protein CPB85DRAFT_1249817 [Mucidula mucida]